MRQTQLVNQLTPLLLALLLLTGCEPATVAPVAPVAFTDDQRGKYAELNLDFHSIWIAAIDTETNRAAILARYDAELNHRVIVLLADTTARGQLLAMLDSLARKANRHPYTKEQLEAAIKLKEQRAAVRKLKL